MATDFSGRAINNNPLDFTKGLGIPSYESTASYLPQFNAEDYLATTSNKTNAPVNPTFNPQVTGLGPVANGNQDFNWQGLGDNISKGVGLTKDIVDIYAGMKGIGFAKDQASNAKSMLDMYKSQYADQKAEQARQVSKEQQYQDALNRAYGNGLGR